MLHLFHNIKIITNLYMLYFLFKGVSVFGYFKSELTRGYLLERDQEKFTERRQRVYTFMKTPRELEKVLNKFMYLFWSCLCCCCWLHVYCWQCLKKLYMYNSVFSAWRNIYLNFFRTFWQKYSNFIQSHVLNLCSDDSTFWKYMYY